MKIGQAVQQALEKNGYIYRKSVDMNNVEVKAAIKPTNTYECCILIIFSGNTPQAGSRCWNPTAEDLMAEDWGVTILEEY